jgi:hypothetical protein
LAPVFADDGARRIALRSRRAYVWQKCIIIHGRSSVA